MPDAFVLYSVKYRRLNKSKGVKVVEYSRICIIHIQFIKLNKEGIFQTLNFKQAKMIPVLPLREERSMKEWIYRACIWLSWVLIGVFILILFIKILIQIKVL